MNTTPPNTDNTELGEIEEALDKISYYNELGGRGHGDLKDTCYICGISPQALKRQINALISKAKIDAKKDERKRAKRMARIIPRYSKEYICIEKAWWDRRQEELKDRLIELEGNL